MKTIRQQLLFGLIGGSLACTLVAGVAMYYKVLEEANELFDYQLRQLATTVPALGTKSLAPRTQGDPEEDIVVQAWDRTGKLDFASTSTGLLPRSERTGYAVITTAGEQWRTYSAWRNGELVQVAQAMSAREEVVAQLALRSLLPFLLMIPVLGGLIFLVVGRSLRPLGRLASAVAQRSPSALQPLPTQGQPPELAPVVVALNTLLHKLEHALAGQRAFVADAAHELRSPLTALKLQLQLAERATDEQQRARAFTKLHERLDRSTHLLEQLLTSARQESASSHRAAATVNLVDLAQRCVADRYVYANAKGIDLGVDAAAKSVGVVGYFPDLQIMLGNLIDNALRYTPAPGRVDVSVRIDGGRPLLQVADTGPGIPFDERTRVFGRFYRGEGHDAWGSGLGLSIVKSVAEAHRAQIQLDGRDGAGGLLVSVRFPAPAEGH